MSKVVIERFDVSWCRKLHKLDSANTKFGNGQVTVVGGSSLFHGAPVLALKAVSRMVSMVYFSAFEADREVVNKIKSLLSSFIWVSRKDLNGYIRKSGVVLIGPGMMRNRREDHGFSCDNEGMESRELGLRLFEKFNDKKWVIDGGCLQVMGVDELPKGSVVTPNSREFEMLFGEKMKSNFKERAMQVKKMAKEYGLVILAKSEKDIVSDGKRVVVLSGGNKGLSKGGTGDVLAGVLTGLYLHNEPFLAAAVASFMVKEAGDILMQERADMYNADDVADAVARVWGAIEN